MFKLISIIIFHIFIGKIMGSADSEVFELFGDSTSRIVGGFHATKNQFPYQIFLKVGKYGFCGGSIITAKHILTAAHCVSNKGIITLPENLQVYAGSVDLNDPDRLVRSIKSVRVHEGYKISDRMLINDIALLELAEPLEFSNNVSKIELNTQDIPPGAKIIVSGWGRDAENGKTSKILKYNYVSGMSPKECFTLTGIFRKEILCFSRKIGNGVCYGDSGGPAVYNGKLVGATSFGIRSCGSQTPDMYANVANYIDWINKYTK